jgi:L-rhamnose mutarotase
MKYEDMNDWLGEIENYGTRLERFYEDVAHLTDNNLRNYSILLSWMNAAFEAGKGERDEKS